MARGHRTCGPKTCEATPRSARGPAGSRWIRARVLARMAGTGCRLFGLHPAAFDPHLWSGGLPGHSMWHHHKRRPDPSLPRLTDPFCRAWVGEGGVRFPKSRTKRNRLGLASSFAGRRPTCARKVQVSLTGGARVICAKPLLPSTTGLSPVPHKSGSYPDDKTAPRPPANFSRAGFWCG